MAGLAGLAASAALCKPVAKQSAPAKQVNSGLQFTPLQEMHIMMQQMRSMQENMITMQRNHELLMSNQSSQRDAKVQQLEQQVLLLMTLVNQRD